jgi:hypothetical protein
LSVYELHEPVPLKLMKEKYEFKGAPRGLVYLPEALGVDVWGEQKKLL